MRFARAKAELGHSLPSTLAFYAFRFGPKRMRTVVVELVDDPSGPYYELGTPGVLLEKEELERLRFAMRRQLGALMLPPNALRWVIV